MARVRVAYLVPIFLLLLGPAFALDLNYWIEPDASGNPSKVWVKVPSIPAGGSVTIYARQEAGYSPSVGGTVIYYDTLTDTSNWTLDSGSVSVVGGAIAWSGMATYDNAWYHLPQSYDLPITVEFWAKIDGGEFYYAVGALGTTKVWQGDNINLSSTHEQIYNYYDGDGTKTVIVDNYDPAGVWHKVVMRITSSGFHVDIYAEDGTLLGSQDLQLNSYGTAVEWIGMRPNSVSTAYIRGLLLRAYAEQDPTVTVTDMGDYYKIDISNPNSTDLTDFQISVSASELGVTSTTESLHFSDQPFSGLAVSVSYSPNTTEELALDPENGKNEVNVTYTATVTAVGVNVTYWKWIENGTIIEEGNTDINTATLTRTYDTVGDYNVCFYAEGVDNLGNEFNAIDCQVVYVDEYPQNVAIDVNEHILTLGDRVTFTGSAQDNGTVTYEWNVDGGFTLNATTGSTITADANAVGTWTVTLKVCDDVGLCKTATAQYPIYVNPYLEADNNTPRALQEFNVWIRYDPRLNITGTDWNTTTDGNVTPYVDHAVIYYSNIGTKTITAIFTLTDDANHSRTFERNTTVEIQYITLHIEVKDEDNPSNAFPLSSLESLKIEVWNEALGEFVASETNVTTMDLNLLKLGPYRVTVTASTDSLTYSRSYYVGGDWNMTLYAYMLDPSAGVFYTIFTTDIYNNPLEAYKVVVLGYINNSWVSIAEAKSNPDGSTSIFIRPAKYYKVRVENTAGDTVKYFDWFADPNIRTLYVRVGPSAETTQVDLTTVFSHVQYSIEPLEAEFNADANVTIRYTITDGESGLQEFGIYIYKNLFDTNTLVYTKTIVGSPSGGEITFTPTTPGRYIVIPWFKRDNTEYNLPLTLISIHNPPFFSGPIGLSSWSYVLLATIITAMVVGATATVSPGGSAILGLVVFGFFTALNPTASILGISMWHIFLLTAVVVLAVSFLRTYL